MNLNITAPVYSICKYRPFDIHCHAADNHYIEFIDKVISFKFKKVIVGDIHIKAALCTVLNVKVARYNIACTDITLPKKYEFWLSYTFTLTIPHPERADTGDWTCESVQPLYSNILKIRYTSEYRNTCSNH